MTTKPDRHFIAFVHIDMPWCSSPKAWQPVSNEIVLFEQPDMPAYDDIVSAVKQACPAATGVVLNNLHEISHTDFLSFINGSKDWEVSA